MVNFSFKHKNKGFNLNVRECRTFFSKMFGLMFRKKSKSLLFIFNGQTREGIHSFFCVPFVAIWFNEDKIIDVKLVKPWRPYIVPGKSFDKFLEIPINDKNFSRIKSIFNL
jgi:uncharacterized membrane protein (UPF0127 family)